MKKFNFSKLLIAVVMASSLMMLSGCKPEEKTPEISLYGEWESEWDGYTITQDKITYNDGGYGYDWTADLLEITDIGIFYKFTSVGTALYSASLVGKFGETSYKDLSVNGCKFSDATDSSFAKGAKDTLEDAKSTLTGDDWHSLFGTYEKK